MRWKFATTCQGNNVTGLYLGWYPFRVVVDDSTYRDTSAPKLPAFLDEVDPNDALDRSVPNVLTNLDVDVPAVVEG